MEITERCLQSVQARLWQVGKLMPQKLARHMEVSFGMHTLADPKQQCNLNHQPQG